LKHGNNTERENRNMASLNKVILIGNLTRDPESKTIPSGVQVCEFGLAVNSRGQDGQELAPLFIEVTAWERTAENCAKYLTRGSPVAVEGKLKLDTWEKDGQKHSRISVVAFNVQFLSNKGDNAPSGRPRPLDQRDGEGPGPAIPDEDDDAIMPF